MPELPEVESFKKYMDDHALHQPIKAIKFVEPSLLLTGTTPARLKSALEDNTFEGTFRHGKFLFIELKRGENLMMHFGMTGELEYYTPDARKPRVYALLIMFKNGKNLAFSDARKLGKIAIVGDVQEFIDQRGYGPDALKVSLDDFIALVSKRRTAIKAVLMNQKIIAGVGNEFSDEILFQSRIHPASVANRIPVAKLKEVYEQTRKILKEAVSHNADREKLDHYFFLGHRKAGLTCPRCKGETSFETIGGRSSYFCAACQKFYE
jgi:formamidopyrimidine-DNA glycosylase